MYKRQPTQWGLIIDQIVGEIEAAVGDERVKESTRLRSDLVLKSVVVLAEAKLLRFEAPRQFPDSWIHAQLDEQFGLDDLAIAARDVGAETMSFDTVEDLLDHVSKDNTSQEPQKRYLFDGDGVVSGSMHRAMNARRAERQRGPHAGD